TITLTSDLASNSPRIISVTLHVLDGAAIDSVISSAFNDPRLSPRMFVSIYGSLLAPEFVLPDQLSLLVDGTRITITDADGVEWEVLIHFISPGQINILIPGGVALGLATVTIHHLDGIVA